MNEIIAYAPHPCLLPLRTARLRLWEKLDHAESSPNRCFLRVRCCSHTRRHKALQMRKIAYYPGSEPSSQFLHCLVAASVFCKCASLEANHSRNLDSVLLIASTDSGCHACLTQLPSCNPAAAARTASRYTTRSVSVYF